MEAPDFHESKKGPRGTQIDIIGTLGCDCHVEQLEFLRPIWLTFSLRFGANAGSLQGIDAGSFQAETILGKNDSHEKHNHAHCVQSPFLLKQMSIITCYTAGVGTGGRCVFGAKYIWSHRCFANSLRSWEGLD